MLARSNYEVQFRPEQQISERILFPATPSQRNGIEDARFVCFQDDDGTPLYYATFTAYDGRVVVPELVETADFLHFRFRTLNGPAAENKGMALFPRKINGRYAMLSRQDNENIYLMFSDNVHFWNERQVLLTPAFPWELVQLGNCGSPIETDAGWLVLSHGVGAMRKYCIGAFLLDRDDPAKVIGRLREPLIKPNENEREGYVPNVVYTCGALLHNGRPDHSVWSGRSRHWFRHGGTSGSARRHGAGNLMTFRKRRLHDPAQLAWRCCPGFGPRSGRADHGACSWTRLLDPQSFRDAPGPFFSMKYSGTASRGTVRKTRAKARRLPVPWALPCYQTFCRFRSTRRKFGNVDQRIV